MAFPVPSGPFGVGSATHQLVDADRPEFLGGRQTGRRISMKLWYPSVRSPTQAAELLWHEARADSRAPLPVRLLLKCLRTRTVTRTLAPISGGSRLGPIVIYNHGLVSFAAENTSLMEELASHGQVVLALSHTEQYAELQALRRSQPEDQRRHGAAIMQKLRRAQRDERAELALSLYRSSTNTNRIVAERARDTRFVLERLPEVLGQIPGYAARSTDPQGIHLVGYSVGGAVATEVAASGTRYSSVVNLDGGLYGTHAASGLEQPYLMLYSSISDGINELLLPAQATSRVFEHSTHLNFHDIATIMPYVRYLGITGKADPHALIARRNTIVREFIGAHRQSSPQGELPDS